MANHHRMTRRFLLGSLFVLALSTPAWADNIAQKKQSVDSKLATLHGTLAEVQHEQTSLRDQIAGVTARIRTLEARVGDVSLQLQTLEQDLSLRRQRLDKLNQ